MIDTIRIESPPISRLLYEKLRARSLEKLAINNETGEFLYNFTSNDLTGSYDNRIMIQMKEERYVSIYSAMSKTGRATELLPSEPYLVIELSIHKFYEGHNIKNGKKMLQPMFKDLVKFLSCTFKAPFPKYSEWFILRLDYAETFRIKNIEKYFKYLKNCEYSRRKVMRYDTAIFIPGTTTSVRLYSKEHEFKKHDYKKLKDRKDIDIISLLRDCKDMLRCEVQINKRKLCSLNKNHVSESKNMKVKNYSLKVIQTCYENEVKKIFQLIEHDRVYNDAKSVHDYLYSNYDHALAQTLFSTYSSLCMFGKEDTKKNMPKSTFYRHLKLFKDMGISFTNSDIKLEENKNDYADFVPTLDSIYKIS